MKSFPLIKRKSLLNEVSESQVIALTQKNEYFKNRPGGNTFFTQYDASLVCIAAELFEFFPFRNVSEVVNDLVKNYRNLYGLLKKNPNQFLIVEKKTENIGLEISHYVVYPLLVDSMRVMDWTDRGTMVMVNLAKIYAQIEKLFEAEGMNVPFR